MRDPTERPCDCGIAIRCVDARGPVRYDESLNEFLLDVGRQSYRWIYCFNCGGRLPESMRGRRFTTPSTDDCAAVAAILPRCRTVADVLRELGPGDRLEFWDARQ